jgi:hypothetical protein
VVQKTELPYFADQQELLLYSNSAAIWQKQQ